MLSRCVVVVVNSFACSVKLVTRCAEYIFTKNTNERFTFGVHEEIRRERVVVLLGFQAWGVEVVTDHVHVHLPVTSQQQQHVRECVLV